jgi:hypothetical protein
MALVNNGLSRGGVGEAPAPALTSAMVALAWSILHLNDDDGEAAHVLAKLIIEAAEEE